MVEYADEQAEYCGLTLAGLGAEVHRQADLMPRYGAVLGKGDALWRSLAVLTGDVVCFLDADSEDFGPHFALGLLGAYYAATDGVLMAMTSAVLPESLRTSGLGVLTTVTSLGRLIRFTAVDLPVMPTTSIHLADVESAVSAQVLPAEFTLTPRTGIRVCG